MSTSHSPQTPKTAMVLAAGFGTRMKPLTESRPKPMIEVSGRTLIDRAIDRLEDAGVSKVVVNLHHLGDMIESHLSQRPSPEIVFSWETYAPLETGGGVVQALPLLGNDPFFVVNADAMWLNGSTDALGRMGDLWDANSMDALLMVHSTVDAYGYRGRGDFEVDSIGTLTRRQESDVSPYLFTGIQILQPSLFEGRRAEPFSLNEIYNQSIETERLFGMVHDGEWFHVGTPDGLADAEKYVNERYAGIRHR